MNPSSGTGGAPYIVLPLSVVQSCSEAAKKALYGAIELIRGEERANMPEPWPGRLQVKVRLQDPENGRFLKDKLAGCDRLWEAKSER